MSVCKGRFDYIKRGIVGVCAATLLTGVVAAPAFAVIPDVTPGSATEITSGTPDAVSTEVKAQAEVAQISATVPTTVIAAVDSSGSLTFPDNNAFVIKATNASWPVKVSDLKVDVTASGYSLKANEAGLAAAKDMYLTLGGKALTADVNTDAIAGLEQTSANGSDIGIAMAGKIYNPSYADVVSGLSLATLKWTLAAF